MINEAVSKVFEAVFYLVTSREQVCLFSAKTYTGKSIVEIDATVLNSVAVGQTYPILTRIPLGGRPIINASDSTLRRWNGQVKIRVNLVGPQSSKDETIGYKIFNSPITSIAYGATLTTTQAPPSGQVPAQAAATLSVQNAVAGTH